MASGKQHSRKPVLPRFTIFLIVRIALLIGNVLLFISLDNDGTLFFTKLILGLIFIAQLVELVFAVNHTNRELARLLNAVHYSDYTVSFDRQALGWSFRDLHESLTGVMHTLRDAKIEKEGQYQFLQKLVNQMSVGVIALDNNEIELINPTAQSLLDAKGIVNWKLLQQRNPEFTAAVDDIGASGRKLVELTREGVARSMTVESGTITILGKEHRIITIQDINSEIEQKEIEAWHKLINILTHEIMNSITPVSSLTETMQDMLRDKAGNPKTSAMITDETISDLLFSLSTIQRRSEALQHFVGNYRKVTRVPRAKKATVDVKALLSSVGQLMHTQLEKQHVKLSIDCKPDDVISADQALVEQVLINLVTNSIYALEQTATRYISLKGYSSGSQYVVEVADNGKGIPEKELRQIFIPFFTTREDGSGIGLSLSKQIMSSHGGTIRVQSQEGKGASFFLYFPS